MNNRPPPARITIVTHAVMVDGQDNFGPAHNVVDYFAAQRFDVDFVLHPLASGGDELLRSYRATKLVAERPLLYRRTGRLGEAALNASIGLRDPADVLVALDPLNLVTAGLPRKLLRRRLVVYYTPDYADRRFPNRLVNNVYHLLDRAAVRTADVVWNVSQRITDKRREQGLPDERNLFVPNAPAFDPRAIVPYGDRTPESLVLVGAFDATLDDGLLLGCLERLGATRPAFRLVIAGTGAGEENFRSELVRRKLVQNVELTGYLPHGEALAIVRASRVGLAFYSGRASWNEYGDSVKVREYLTLGVPVVTTGNHSVAAELQTRGAGVVVSDPVGAAAAIEGLFEDSGPAAADRAAEMAKAYDRQVVLATIVDDLSRRLSAHS